MTAPLRKRAKMLSPERELELAKAWKDRGCLKAREELICAYRPLAANMAMKVAEQSGRHMYEDLRQEADACLLVTLDKFKLETGYRFGTFARHHVESALRRYVMDYSGICRVGTNLSDKRVFSQYRKLRAEIEKKTGRLFDDAGRQEMAEILAVPVDVIKRMEPRIVRGDVSVAATLEPGEDDGENGSHGEILVEAGPSPEAAVSDQVDRTRVRAALAAALEELDEDERYVVTMRHLERKTKPLHEIGDKLKLSRKAVNGIERRALAKLMRLLQDAGIGAEECAALLAS